MTTFKNKFLKYNIHLYLGIYFIFNLLTLTKFPFVHSDEAWLAGLSNEYILHKSIFVSESFFDLMPRTIHTIKSFYHLLQLPFIGLFGNTVFTVRLISLIASTITLYFFYKLLRSIKVHHYRALLYTIIFSLNLQFVYAAHFGRQEMLLLMMLSMSIYLYYKKRAIFKTAPFLAALPKELYEAAAASTLPSASAAKEAE
jgi:4-amino-4-deoxy-L-arabinose transferase-like glycosyltransferase